MDGNRSGEAKGGQPATGVNRQPPENAAFPTREQYGLPKSAHLTLGSSLSMLASWMSEALNPELDLSMMLLRAQLSVGISTSRQQATVVPGLLQERLQGHQDNLNRISAVKHHQTLTLSLPGFGTLTFQLHQSLLSQHPSCAAANIIIISNEDAALARALLKKVSPCSALTKEFSRDWRELLTRGDRQLPASMRQSAPAPPWLAPQDRPLATAEIVSRLLGALGLVAHFRQLRLARAVFLQTRISPRHKADGCRRLATRARKLFSGTRLARISKQRTSTSFYLYTRTYTHSYTHTTHTHKHVNAPHSTTSSEHDPVMIRAGIEDHHQQDAKCDFAGTPSSPTTTHAIVTGTFTCCCPASVSVSVSPEHDKPRAVAPSESRCTPQLAHVGLPQGAKI